MKIGSQKPSTPRLSPLDAMTKRVLRARKIEKPTPAQMRAAKADVFKAADILGVTVTKLAKDFN